MKGYGMIKKLLFLQISAILILISFSILISPAEGQELEQGKELNEMTLHLSEGMTLSPLDPPETDVYSAVAIPNGYRQTGFRGYGIIPVGSTIWIEVGTWYTEPLKNEINLGGTVKVEAIAYKEASDQVTPNCQFRFQIRKESEVLMEITTQTYNIPLETKLRVGGTGNFPPGNDTTVEAGVRLSFKIYAKSNGGGAALRFGTREYDSKFIFSSNALEINTVYMTKEEVIMEYRDAFMVPWTQLHVLIEIDRVKIPNQDMSSIMNSLNYTREIHWERKSSPGEYTVFTSIGYTMDQNLSQQRVVEITQKRQSWFEIENIQNLLSGNIFVIAIIVIVLAVVFLFIRYRKQVWKRRFRRLPPDIQLKDKKEKRRAWKDMAKVRKKRLQENRLERVVDEDEVPDEDELREKEFNLFKTTLFRGSPGTPEEDVEELEL
jgi:hypothetical protein